MLRSVLGSPLLRHIATIARNKAAGAGHETFLQALYRACFNREPDPAGYDEYLRRLKARELSWADLLRAFIASPEFVMHQQARFTQSRATLMLHEARTILFREHIPAAEVIVDLGGAADNYPYGALFLMGYPHTPKELTIVDLPPAIRFTGEHNAEREREVVHPRGTLVRYVYTSMSDLGFLAGGSVDLVISGESIEHVTEEESDAVCRQVRHILKPGGHFCLDTPNARLTRLQSPDSLIHPEHKKEYSVEELRNKLLSHGFRIEKALGVTPMPFSLRTGAFSFDEMVANPYISTEPEQCYIVYFDVVNG